MLPCGANLCAYAVLYIALKVQLVAILSRWCCVACVRELVHKTFLV